MFVREILPTLDKTVGPETKVTSLRSPKTGRYFQAARRGLKGARESYLVEGGNVFMENGNRPIKAFSANDYVRKYGISLDYLPAGSNLQAPFKPVMDANGELIDFATTMNLREIMHGTWLGRPQLETAPDGKLWMKFHFVPIESIPKGAPVEGWPSEKDFVKYGRITAAAPVKIVNDKNGQPLLQLDIDPQFQYLYEN